MKFLFTFFLFICFHLTGANRSIDVSNFNSKTGHSGICNLVKTKGFERTRDGQSGLLTKLADTPGENDLLIFEEEDNDEENAGRKCKPLIDCYSKFFYSCVVTYTCEYLTKPLFLRRFKSYSNSCKYISQRALRI